MEYKTWIKGLSLREQALLLTGRDFWHTSPVTKCGIPSIMVSDGPNGLRKEEQVGPLQKGTMKAVCYPSATALAASWDRNVMSMVGSSLADECKSSRVSVLLGPGINIKRSPLCGRNFEYYSEDPYLAGELAASYINAVQEKGIGTSLKHFAANNTETRRMVSNSLVDERALREIYLRGFEIAVKKAQPWTVMCAYNKLNGTYCTENSYLINDILRGEWGFTGLTVSDWASINDRIASLNAGLDLEMPSTGYANVRKIAKAYRKGEVPADTIEESAGRVLDLVTKAEPNLKIPVEPVDWDAHHKLAGQLAEQCVVLLKNEGNFLPVSKEQKIAVIGERARTPLYQGYGSAQINSYQVDNVLDSLVDAGANVQYSRGYRIEKSDEVNTSLINEACEIARNCDVALIFVSCAELDVSESSDRNSISLPKSQTELIEAVCRVNPNAAVIVTTGSCIEMPWVNAPRAIIQSYLLGEASGVAIANILLGKTCPSGKLPETYPIRLEDTPCLDNYKTDTNDNVLYKESIFVGYRYYDKTNTPVLFPFGHGLSYTKFEYSDIHLSSNKISSDNKLTVTFTLTNNGSYSASEVVQVYVGLADSAVYRAPKELKRFEKVFVVSGTQQKVSIELNKDAFEYYSTELGAWVVESGKYEIMIGSSSSDIRLKTSVEVDSVDSLSEELDYKSIAPNYFAGNIKSVTNEEFEDILGMYIEDFLPYDSDDRMTVDHCLSDALDTPGGKGIGSFVEKTVDFFFKDDAVMREIVYSSVMNIPIKRFVSNTRGVVSDTMAEALVHYLNSKSAFESAKIVAYGLPDSIMNILTPLIRGVIEKRSRR